MYSMGFQIKSNLIFISTIIFVQLIALSIVLFIYKTNLIYYRNLIFSWLIENKELVIEELESSSFLFCTRSATYSR